MFDLIITPVTNKSLLVMKLYDKLRHQLTDNESTITFINNGSTDGLSPKSFHTHNRIRYIHSKTKIPESILVNHAILEKDNNNEYILFIQPETQISKGYFSNIEQVIIDNPEIDIIFGRVDNKVKKSAKIVKDARDKKWQEFTQKRNSGALLKNPPPVREISQKNDQKQQELQTLTHSDNKKTVNKIGTQNISADFSSRLEEPQDAQILQRAESISLARDENCQMATKSVSDEKRHQSEVTKIVGDKKCQAIFSDKKCQCEKCVVKDTAHIKLFNSDKEFNIKLFNIKTF